MPDESQTPTAEAVATTDGTAEPAAPESKPAASQSETGAGPGGALRADESSIREALSEVYDPEIGIDIVSLGLVYGHVLDAEGNLQVDMTLTSPYCPLGGVITDQVQAVCAPLPGVETVAVNFVFTPPWDPRTMASDEAKLDLGIY